MPRPRKSKSSKGNDAPHAARLSRRERQAMDVIYALSRATAAEVHERLPDPPSYSSVRSMLSLLEEKGFLCHEQDGPRYVYMPTVPREKARTSALQHLLATFFDGSTEDAVAALLDLDSTSLDPESVERIKGMIEQARKEGR